MGFEHYLRAGSKKLRCGYTTGTCAALAAAGAARALLLDAEAEPLRLLTPGGLTVEVLPERWERSDGAARCAVRKDAGDDPDATDGCLIEAEARRIERGIVIDGGAGVGIVTKPGLDQPIGAAAINSVPRRMIARAVEEVCAEAGYSGGLSVVISVPDGAEIAKHTFNPVLGVEGGISILGTSGIVEPMSERALVDTLNLTIRQIAASGERRLLLTPGNYGADYLARAHATLSGVPMVKCSNFIGDALDAATAEGFEEVLLVGHVGKLVKLAGGVMNTHSKWADCRAELFCAHAAISGADASLCRALMECATTDACIALLDGAGLRGAVLKSLLDAVDRHLTRRAAGAFIIGAELFSNEFGFLGRTAAAEELLQRWGET